MLSIVPYRARFVIMVFRLVNDENYFYYSQDNNSLFSDSWRTFAEVSVEILELFFPSVAALSQVASSKQQIIGDSRENIKIR